MMRLVAATGMACLLAGGAGAAPGPATWQDAARFLAQATFGARETDIEHLMRVGYDQWLTEQVAMRPSLSYRAETARLMPCATDLACPNAVDAVFWRDAVADSAQLRARMAFALSQIFVISTKDASLRDWGNAAAAHADVLAQGALGDFRALLEAVTRDAAMGQFLSEAYNDKENPKTGAIPDQNYAREVMQLFTIGLVRLREDGTPVLDADRQPVPTYAQADVEGASYVLTGFAPPGASERDWRGHFCFCRDGRTAAQFAPMVGYPAHHSTLAKRFLGVTIAATSAPDPDGELRVFLDTLFNHPNVGPFIGRQLIQRLVTSNPSPAYVARVAAAFANNGHGTRGDLAAVARAILLDPEARSDINVAAPTFGKIREPVLRFAHLMRVFDATTGVDPASFEVPNVDHSERKDLWQTPFDPDTVFNFYYPDYTPPDSALAARGLVSPEMQITTTTSIGDQDRFLDEVYEAGGLTRCCSAADLGQYTMKLDYAPWLTLVTTPSALADRLDRALMAGQMSAGLRADVIAAMAAAKGTRDRHGIERGVTQIKLAEALRVLIASPDYVVQK